MTINGDGGQSECVWHRSEIFPSHKLMKSFHNKNVLIKEQEARVKIRRKNHGFSN
jgi:hypothetical protein